MLAEQDETRKRYEEDIGPLDVYGCYKRSPYSSIKHSSYFQVYTELLERYRGRTFTFVEVGVLNGGSLFMWRDYFGPQARIIGIDFNPGAARWTEEGFEIHIGSQSDPEFWRKFFESVGPVDVVLDDGGHTYEQQIVTVHECIPHIKDGGLMIVEDTHTSYFKEFGHPSRYSFIEWTKRLVDNINCRFPAVKVSSLPYKDTVYSISYFESIVCFKIDRRKCFVCAPTRNDGTTFNAQDFRDKGTAVDGMHGFSRKLTGRFPVLKKMQLLKVLKDRLLATFALFATRRRLKQLRRFF